MRTNEHSCVVRRVSSAVVLALAVIASPALATDIAWHSKTEPASWAGANYERKGTVDFKTGEQGSFLSYGTNRKVENGLMPWIAVYVFRFDDLSSITVKQEGTFDPASQVSKGSGEFLGGTGRFEGITGKVTLVGRFSGSTAETDWVGAYTLPGK